MDYWSDYIAGTGAAIDLEIGFIPDAVTITDLSATRIRTMGLTHKVLAFDGGAQELKEGDIIVGHSARARGVIKKVIITGGSWGGNNAAGFIVLEHEEQSGTFADNDNLQVASQKGNYGGPAPAVSATVSAVVNGGEVNTDSHNTGAGGATEATASATQRVTAYDGTSAGRGKGVTLGSAVIGDNDLAFVEARRSGPS